MGKMVGGQQPARAGGGKVTPMEIIAIVQAALALTPGVWQFVTDIVNHNRAEGRVALTPEQEAEIVAIEEAAEADFDARVADARKRLGLA